MPSFELRLSLPNRIGADRLARTFLWRRERPNSFLTKLGPSLGDFGPVPRPNVDLVRLAAGVFAADRSVRRAAGGSNWSTRDIDLLVPVSDPDRWNSAKSELAAVVAFLTGDNWHFDFRHEAPPAEQVATPGSMAERVLLLSGGADSAIGALAVHHGEPHSTTAMVSYLTPTNIARRQREVLQQIEVLTDSAPQPHHQVRISRRRERLDGSAYPKDFSTRSRSLLFISLGLAVAAVHGVKLVIAENGFASLNPPLKPNQRGTLSTRTTHPAFLRALVDTLRLVDVHCELEMPFERRTKGEMFREAAALLGPNDASAFLSLSHSCGHTGHKTFRYPVLTHCGVCFACIVRRSAFRSAGLEDRTLYLSEQADTRLDGYLRDKSMVEAMREFVRSDDLGREVAALSLPPSYPASAAYDLFQRAISEFRQAVG